MNKAGLIRCYDGNVSSGSLKFTLRVPLLSSSFTGAETTLPISAGGGESGTLKKIIFAHGGTSNKHPSHLCGTLQQSTSYSSSVTSIFVWDLNRGVLSHTIDIRNTSASASKKKKRKASSDSLAHTEVVCDITTYGDQLYALILLSGEADGDSISKGKIRLYQYDLSAKEVTLVKKIKVGSTSSSSAGSLNRVAISQTSIAVRMGHQVRVLDLITGEKRGRVDFPSELTPSTSEEDAESASPTFDAPFCISSDGRYIITTTSNNQVIVFSDKDELTTLSLCSTKDDTCPITNLDFTEDNNGDDVFMLLAFQPFVGIASLFIVSADMTMVPQMPQAQLHVNAKKSASSPYFVQAGFHPRTPKESVLLLFQSSNKHSSGGSATGSGTNLLMESLSYDNLQGRVLVGTSLLLDEKKARGEKKKRKSDESLALAPGDQGQESSSAIDLTLREKMAKVQRKENATDKESAVANSEDLCGMQQDEEQGQSIAERLALLSSAMEQTDDEGDGEYDGQGESNTHDTHNSKTKLNSATSETLSTLLIQALSSNDTVQLNIALQVVDRRLIEDTVRTLQLLDAERGSEQENTRSLKETKTGYISTLMAHIVRRMARRHSLVMQLGVWVRAILAAAMRSSTNQLLYSRNTGGNDERMAKEGRELAMKLGPLKNFLNERVESFPHLMRLEGRLGLLNPQL